MHDPKHRINEYCTKTIGAIHLLSEENLYDHCLILIYSSIDVLGLLNAEDDVPSANITTFKAWAKKYMKLDQLNITETDIYSARCGLLHTHTAQSNISKNKRAKELIYLLKKNESSQLQTITKDPRMGDSHQYVYMDDLINSLALGMTNFIKAVDQTNPALIERTSRLLRCQKL